MKKATVILFVVVLLAVAADFLYEKHGYFSFEEWPGFHAFFGFGVCVAAAGVAVAVGQLLRRGEDYHDR